MRFVHEVHPRTLAHRKGTTEDPVTVEQQRGSSLLDRAGLKITVVVGTMWCAIAFAIIALVALPGALRSGDPVVIVAWVSQAFLQLVLLPIIIVGQNLQAKASDARAEQTFRDAEAVLHECLEIQRHLLEQDKALTILGKGSA